ncbi:MAG: hypothetical protein Q9169_003602 [Polycauliona sp. 2 TL-2023]
MGGFKVSATIGFGLSCVNNDSRNHQGIDCENYQRRTVIHDVCPSSPFPSTGLHDSGATSLVRDQSRNLPGNFRSLIAFSVGGYLAAILDTSSFAAAQVPSNTPALLTPTTQILALQLGNCYGLIALIAIGVLYSTSEPRVVRNYLIACTIADIGHIWVTYAVLGYSTFMDIKGWNSLAWGNIGFTFFLFVTRIAYLAGLFGNDKVPASIKKRA